MTVQCPTCGKTNLETRTQGDCVIAFCSACGEWKGIYGSSAEQSKFIAQAIAESRQKEAYKKGESLLKQAKEHGLAEEYQGAKEQFRLAGGYGDAASRIKECEKGIQSLRARKRGKSGAIIAIIVIAIVAAAAFYILRIKIPGDNYTQAGILFEEGEYEEALELYQKSSGYSDSSTRIMLCEALIDLQNADQEAIQSLLDYVQDGQSAELTALVSESLLDIAANWESAHLTPQTVLWLVSQSELFDAEQTLDVEDLRLQAYLQIADEQSMEDWFVAETEESGDSYLAVLRQDGDTQRYQLGMTTCELISMNRAQRADQYLAFYERLLSDQPELALECAQSAYQERSDDEGKAAIVVALQNLAQICLQKEEYEDAAQYAASADQTVQTKESFEFYVNLQEEIVEAEEDPQQGVALWQTFCSENRERIKACQMEEQIQSYTAQRSLACAMTLSSWCDEEAPSWFQTAKDEGADIKASLQQAIDYYPIGVTRLVLKRLLLKEYDSDTKSSEYQELLADVQGEVQSLLEEEELSDAQRLQVLLCAYEISAMPENIDFETYYEELLHRVVNVSDMKQAVYEDWNDDGFTDVIGLDAQGQLILYAASATGITDEISEEDDWAQMTVVQTDVIRILLTDRQENKFAVYFINDEQHLEKEYIDEEISAFAFDGQSISYQKLVMGSIERFRAYIYQLGEEGQPVEGEILVPASDEYSYPESAQQAVLQGMEAYALELYDELAYLQGTLQRAYWMSADITSALPEPDFPVEIELTEYWIEESCEFLRVSYLSQGNTVIRYICTETDDDGWKITGASDTPMDMEGWEEPESQIVPFGSVVSGDFTAQGEQETYIVILPFDARLVMQWYAAEINSIEAKHQVQLVLRTEQENVIFDYSLRSSRNQQNTSPLFLSAGIYEFTVTALDDQYEGYQFRFDLETGIAIEHEANDDLTDPEEIQVNTEIHGNLSGSEDKDYFVFTSEEEQRVQLQLSSDSEEEFLLQLVDQESMHLITQEKVTAQGSTQEAYLSAGSYIVAVSNSRSWAGSEYALYVAADRTEYTELEPDNTPENAAKLPLNQEITGNSSYKNDIDYYSLSIDEDSLIQLKITSDDTASQELYTVELLTNEEYPLWSGTYPESEAPELVLPAGEYLVQVTNSKATDASYQLYAAAETVDSEKEPNDLISGATLLDSGVPLYGSILTLSEDQSQDVDNYQIQMTEPGMLQLSLQYELQDGWKTLYQLTLADEDLQVIWRDTANQGSNTLESPQLWLAAGTYTLQLIEGKVKSSDCYQITAMTAADPEGEEEPNDAVPTPISIGTAVKGTLQMATDLDCFSIYLEEETVLQISLETEGDDTGTFQLSLLSEDGTDQLWSETVDMSQGSYSKLLQIPAGSYQLQLSSGTNWSQSVYTLSVQLQQ